MANQCVAEHLCLNDFMCMRNAKIFAVFIVLGCFSYHGIRYIKYGSDTCDFLMSDGHFFGDNVWQPYGCMAHIYSKSDAHDCLQYIAYWSNYNYIAFVGDSRIRNLYFSFIQLIGNDVVSIQKAHSDLHFHDDKISVHVAFYWQPMLNKSMLEVFKSFMEMKPSLRPQLIITGSATWSIKESKGSGSALRYFKDNMTCLLSYLEGLNSSTKVVWMLQEPVIEERLSPARSFIINSQIDRYNKAAYKALMLSSVQIWSSSRLVSQGLLDNTTDGVHFGEGVMAVDAQILINMFCNKHLDFIDGTCCKPAEPTTLIQAVILATSLIIIISICVWRAYTILRTSFKHFVFSESLSSTCNGNSMSMDVPCGDSCLKLFLCVARLAAILIYFFVCDRSTIFMKENKHYTDVGFFLPVAYLMSLGIFLNQKSEMAGVLNRDQTDEWKGWMQLIILVYHFTGASTKLAIYMHIRVLVSAYLFLSGYGHFSYFYKSGDFSIYRLLRVLVRLNLIAVLLSLVMKRPYQLYYFVPMVSFWFVMIYILMAIWPRVSSALNSTALHNGMLIVKVSVLTSGITLLFKSQKSFDGMFLTWPLSFLSDNGSLDSWAFRWKLDRYSALSGMIFAFSITKTFEAKGRWTQTSWSFARLSLTGVIAFFSLMGYEIMMSFYCKSKQHCNDIHSYIMFLPILSFIYFRNFLSCLRAKYSSFFAWFGKISLELFICQHHIWLSSDTHGLLVLVPGSNHINVIVTTLVFICVAHELHEITEQLLPYIVPSDWHKLFYSILMAFLFGGLLTITGVP